VLADTVIEFAIALGLGLLVGLQRQRDASPLAGIRTFALASLLGAISGSLAGTTGDWLIAAGLFSLASLLIVANLLAARKPDYDPGLTTELALLVIYLVGVLATRGQHALAVVLGASTAVLLHLRTRLHTLARGLTDTDMRAIMQFVVVALVVLPVLPDREFGPGGVLNPRQVWWMVVLITGIGLASYIVSKLISGRSGAVAAGLLGGLISSTATTASYSRSSRTGADPQATALIALVIMLASSVVFGRVLVLVGTVSPDHFRQVSPPIWAMLALTGGLSQVLWWRGRGETRPAPLPANPSELRIALGFAVLYAIILLAVTYARQFFGDRGLFAVALLSGLTDMDAITLSTANLVQRGQLEPRLGGKVVVVASLSNLAFKAGIVSLLGSPALRRRVFLVFGLALAGGLAVLTAF
jgi:uncharacterized membrane protein (DUF4010 family)